MVLRAYFKNPLGTFLSPIHVLPNCKVSEKSNERFSRNCVTDERTDERTNGRTNVIPQVSNDFVERPKTVVKAIHLKHIRVEGPVTVVTHPSGVGCTNNNARV